MGVWWGVRGGAGGASGARGGARGGAERSEEVFKKSGAICSTFFGEIHPDPREGPQNGGWPRPSRTPFHTYEGAFEASEREEYDIPGYCMFSPLKEELLKASVLY